MRVSCWFQAALTTHAYSHTFYTHPSTSTDTAIAQRALRACLQFRPDCDNYRSRVRPFFANLSFFPIFAYMQAEQSHSLSRQVYSLIPADSIALLNKARRGRRLIRGPSLFGLGSWLFSLSFFLSFHFFPPHLSSSPPSFFCSFHVFVCDIKASLSRSYFTFTFFQLSLALLPDLTSPLFPTHTAHIPQQWSS